jgi:small subunit ribosomal protein S8
MIHDSLAQALSHINNAQGVSKQEVLVAPSSKVLKEVLSILKDNLYVGDFEDVYNGLHLNLIGNINKCGVIKPRFAFSHEDCDKVEKQYLPAKGFGLVIVSTPKGMMTITQAKEQKTGGRLVAYCY